jgi:hypothetical protein
MGVWTAFGVYFMGVVNVRGKMFCSLFMFNGVNNRTGRRSDVSILKVTLSVMVERMKTHLPPHLLQK